MRTTLVALAFALLLVAPASAAPTRAPDPYPEILVELLPEFIAASEARGKVHENASWYPQAAEFLQKAKDAQAAGRFRIVLFDLETYEEVVLANHLNDTTSTLGSDGERRARISSTTRAHLEDAQAAWSGFRKKLHELDGQVQSVHTAENALYAADVALSAILSTASYDDIAREFPKQPTVDMAYVHALVRSSYIPALTLSWATRMVEEVAGARTEGLPPLVDKTNLTGLLREAILVDYSGTNQPSIMTIEEHVQPARNNREGFLAVAGVFAVKRADRLSQMQSQFGDARARRDVVTDADRFMDLALNNTTVEKPRQWGLQGTFSADAVDRGLYAHEIIAAGKGDLGVVLVAWSNIDAAHYAEDIMAKFSPVVPVETPTSRAPGPAPVLLVAVALAFALVVTRRTSK